MMTAFGNMNITNIVTILDSGATCNIFKDRSMFYDYVPVVGEYVSAANGYKLPIHGGSVSLSCGLDLIECCHVPTVTKNLIAESYITNEIRARITKLDTTAVIDRLPKGCIRREIVIYQLNLLCVFTSSDVEPVMLSPVDRSSNSSSVNLVTNTRTYRRGIKRCSEICVPKSITSLL